MSRTPDSPWERLARAADGDATSHGRGESLGVVGRGEYRFEWFAGWGTLPEGVALEDVPGVAVDSHDRVYVFCRGPSPVIVFDQSGLCLTTWGQGMFTRPHGLHVGVDRTVLCVDDAGQRLRSFTSDGRLLMTIAAPDQSAITGYAAGIPSSVRRSAPPFCYPTGAALSADRARLVVTDGYGNARLHWFDHRGRLRASLGEPGSGPGQYIIPHGLFVEASGMLYVCDRENERIQVLTPVGSYANEWPGVNCPNNLVRGPDGRYYVAELGRIVQGAAPDIQISPDAIPAQIGIRDQSGRLIQALRPPIADDEWQFFAPHGIAVDSRGDIYVSEVRGAYSRGFAAPGPALHKLVRC